MVYNDMIYVDGGISDNFPIRVAYRFGKTDIIGICSNIEIDENVDNNQENLKLSWLNLVFLPIFLQTGKTIRKYRKRCTIVDVPLHPSMVYQLQLDTPEIMEMFSAGYKLSQNIIGSRLSKPET
jgi:predicted acylesterase/phospholipase RssA